MYRNNTRPCWKDINELCKRYKQYSRVRDRIKENIKYAEGTLNNDEIIDDTIENDRLDFQTKCSLKILIHELSYKIISTRYLTELCTEQKKCIWVEKDEKR